MPFPLAHSPTHSLIRSLVKARRKRLAADVVFHLWQFANFVQPYNYLPCGLQICTGIREFELEMPPAVREIYGEMDRDCL